MAATIWSGAITFGLVNIPVRLRSAVRANEGELSFRMLHEKDEAPIQYRRYCTREQKEVLWEEIVKGYEYEKDRYIVMTEEDFKQAAGKISKTFEILSFVPPEEIDPRYFEKPYFLTPTRASEKTYALLREAIRETGRVGIGKITIREKQHLAAIHVVEDALVLELMRFSNELVRKNEYSFPSAEGIRPQESTMARQLVENLTEPFEPEQYKDEYRSTLLKIIRGRLEGTVTIEEEEEPEATGVIDLLARLEESLGTATGRKAGEARKKAAGRSGAKKKAGKKKKAA